MQIDESAYENAANSLISKTRSERNSNKIIHKNFLSSDSSLAAAAEKVVSMAAEKSENSSKESYFGCPAHDDENSGRHTCNCSKLKVLREKAVTQVEAYKREKSKVENLRLSMEQSRRESMKSNLDAPIESTPAKTESKGFIECSASCISHQKPHMCSLKHKQRLDKTSEVSTHSRKSREADDEDSEQATTSHRSTARKSSKKSQSQSKLFKNDFFCENFPHLMFRFCSLL